MWWQSLPGWICTFCQWRHPVLPAVSFFLIILHSQYITSSFAFTFFLGVQELGMGSEVEAASLFCLFVSLDDSPLLACVGTEKRERVGKGKALLYFHLSDSLEHEDNIKTGPITYRSYQEPQRVDPSFLCHPSHSLGRVHAIPIPCVPVHEVSRPPLLSLHTRSALWTEAMTHSLWLN